LLYKFLIVILSSKLSALPEQNKASILSGARDGDCVTEGILQNTKSVTGCSIQFSELIRQLGRLFKIAVNHPSQISV
jgi:hypothetical protein